MSCFALTTKISKCFSWVLSKLGWLSARPLSLSKHFFFKLRDSEFGNNDFFEFVRVEDPFRWQKQFYRR